MTDVTVYRSEVGLPLVRLSGRVTESSGAELADKVMLKIYFATEDPQDYSEPMSLRAACVRAPENSS